MNTPASWRGASFRDAELDTLREGAALSFAQKIAWIEEAEEFGLQFQRRRWRAGEGVDPRFVDHLRAEDRAAAGTPPSDDQTQPSRPFVPPPWMAWLD